MIVFKGTHAEINALANLPTKVSGAIGIVVSARTTLIGISRPCINCMYALSRLPVRKLYVAFHAGGLIWIETPRLIRTEF